MSRKDGKGRPHPSTAIWTHRRGSFFLCHRQHHHHPRHLRHHRLLWTCSFSMPGFIAVDKMVGNCFTCPHRWKSNVLLLCFIATYGLGSTFQLSLLFRAQADSDIITVLYCLLAWNKSFRLLTEHTVSTCCIFWFWSYFPKITRKLHTFVPSSSSAPKIGWYWPATARVQGLPKSSVMTRPSPTTTILHSAGVSHRMHSSSCLGILDAYILPFSSL